MIQKITIVDGNPKYGENPLNQFISEFNKELTENGFETKVFFLQEKHIKQCVGCFDCWWKTPGLCRFNDDAPEILKTIINSDFVIYTSPMIMGMYSALLKKFHDRTIPLLHPYIKLVEGECHHGKRYEKYPKMGVIIDPGDSMPDELETMEKIFKRICLNFHSELKFFETTEKTQPKKLSNEISCF